MELTSIARIMDLRLSTLSLRHRSGTDENKPEASEIHR
jgi:hypothetical protein